MGQGHAVRGKGHWWRPRNVWGCAAQAFQDLAEDLPWAKHVHSKLVCAVTREVMNEHNPPMVLPNGAVYSQKAIEQLASAKGVFMCPHTGARCPRCPAALSPV